jgi:hypothetical protein
MIKIKRIKHTHTLFMIFYKPCGYSSFSKEIEKKPEMAQKRTK